MNPQKILRLEVWRATDDPKECRAVYVVEDELHQVTSNVEGFHRWLMTWGYVASNDHTDFVLNELRRGLERPLRLQEVGSITWPTAGKTWEMG